MLRRHLRLLLHCLQGDVTRRLTPTIKREWDGFVALCPELDVASQGVSVSEARENLREALELFFEAASDTEVQHRFSRYVL